MSEPIRVKIKNGIGYISFNRPEKLNSLSTDLGQALTQALTSLDENKEVKVILLSGEGKAFCAGGDLDTIKNMSSPSEIALYLERTINLTRVILNLNKYVISAVHGYAAGAGFSLALASDFIIADWSAKFGLSFVNVGLIPDLGLMKLLAERVPTAIAKEWIVSGKIIGVEEANTWGIVNRVVEGDLLQQASEFAQTLLKGPPLSNKYVKKMLNHSVHLHWDAYLERETMVQALLLQTEDHQEGLRAFYEKRSPLFNGN